MSDEQILKGLKALARADRDREASAAVESKVLQQFRRQMHGSGSGLRAVRARHVSRKKLAWVAAACAAAVAFVIAMRFVEPPPPQPPTFGFEKPVPKFEPLGSSPGVAGVFGSETVVGAVTASRGPIRPPAVKSSRRTARNVVEVERAGASSEPETAAVPAVSAWAADVDSGSGVREVVTNFFPLMDPAPPLERAEVIRVRVPASTMRTVGLPVPESLWNEPVQADVLIGEEGLARAIRFVRVEGR